jgi:hypothetical protein
MHQAFELQWGGIGKECRSRSGSSSRSNNTTSPSHQHQHLHGDRTPTTPDAIEVSRGYMEYIESCCVRFPALPPERPRPARTTHDSTGRNRQARGNGVRMTPLKKQNALLKSLCVLPNAPRLPPLHVTVPARTAHDATRQVGAQGDTAHRTPHGLSAERAGRPVGNCHRGGGISHPGQLKRYTRCSIPRKWAGAACTRISAVPAPRREEREGLSHCDLRFSVISASRW